MFSKSHKYSSDFLAGMLVLLGAALLFIPALLQWRGIFHNDQAMSEFPQHFFLARNLQQGIIPLWNPHLWCGAIPYYAFLYSGHSYHPVLWPFYLLADLSDLNKSYFMITLLPLLFHYLLAASGMFFLIRKTMGFNKLASFAGAIAYSYSPAFAYAYVSQNNLIMQGWLPWLIFVYVKTVENFRLWKLFLGAVFFSFIWLGSSPQYMPFVMIIWVAFVLLTASNHSFFKNKAGGLGPIAVAGGMFLLGTALSSPYIFSLLDGIRYTSLHMDLRLEAAISDIPANSYISYLVTLIVPFFLGSVTGGDFIARRIMFWDANMSGGIAVTFLVFLSLGMVLSKKAECKPWKKISVLGLSLYLFSILCALGGNTPFYKMLVGWIPIVGDLPFPIRYRFIQCFSVSLLVAAGLDVLTRAGVWADGTRLKRTVRLYSVFCLGIIALVLFFYSGKISEDISGDGPDPKTEKIFFSEKPVGVYTKKTSRALRIKAFFDDRSSGEIRCAPGHQVAPEKGTLLQSYDAPGKGWAEFDVSVPPGNFVWFYPKAGPGRMGLWSAPAQSFSYDGRWAINRSAGAILFYNNAERENRSLFFKLKNGDILSLPIYISLIYVGLALSALMVSAYLLPVKKFGWFIAVFVIVEFFTFGGMAFYGGTFNEDKTSSRAFLPHNVRAMTPSDHPMLRSVGMSLPKLISGESLRVASDYPFYDNFAYLNGLFSFMGEPAFPLERRFKKAIETAYGHVMGPSVFYEGGGVFPESVAFLNNFSVGYFLCGSREKIFEGEEILPLDEGANLYIHKNPLPLQRVYTLDKVVAASEDEQLWQLVYGDLRSSVWVDQEDGIKPRGEIAMGNARHFEMLQEKNIIKKVDYGNPNRIALEVHVAIPSMLVLTEVWYPGWEAFVDGVKTKVLRVNYCQRGIWLEKGRHQVQFRFCPASWRIGVAVALGTIVVMAALAWLGHQKHRPG